MQEGEEPSDIDVELGLERLFWRGFQPDPSRKCLALEPHAAEHGRQNACKRPLRGADAGELRDQLLEFTSVDVIRVGRVQHVAVCVQDPRCGKAAVIRVTFRPATSIWRVRAVAGTALT
jgi:hypothetical protein